ncbi:MAG: hypothetical protein OXN96_13435 [Bryobacterales bacterium]|nr:hypothetical protein [Bryobacterales bacterium]
MRGQFVRAMVALLAFAVAAQAQSRAIFLTDGTRLDVREYEVVDDRVRYFSSERGQWEEVPAAIVDLERTNVYNRARRAELEQRQAEERRERLAERRARTELHSVPLEDGVYYLRGQEPVPVEQVFYEIDRSTGRSFLNILAPAPVIAGKRTLSIKGLSASTVTTDEKPAFYIRLDSFSRFGIARIEPERKKDRRIVQQVYTVPRSDEQFEAQEEVEVFRQQLAPLVYKVWPVAPLAAGEYAIVDFTPGESDLRVWAFSHRPGGEAEAR